MYSFLIIFSLFCSFSHAQDMPPSFLDGAKAYQEKDFKKAQEIFLPLLQEAPDNPALLYNSGLTEYQLGNFGMALGLWRKARILDQSMTQVKQAIEFTEKPIVSRHTE